MSNRPLPTLGVLGPVVDVERAASAGEQADVGPTAAVGVSAELFDRVVDPLALTRGGPEPAA